MIRFSFETVAENKQEIRREIAHLLWQIDHTWPLQLDLTDEKWAKSKVDEGWLKLNGGLRRQSIQKIEKKLVKIGPS